MWADERRVKQIIINFLTNALKFTVTGGIFIKTKTKGDMAYISVRDTGIGIKPKNMEKLFTEFCTIAEHQSMNPNGTGLGLYLSQNLAHLMNGEICAKSVYGKGTKFNIKFPIYKSNESDEPLEEIKEEELKITTEKMLKIPDELIITEGTSMKQFIQNDINSTILIVDDNPINCFILGGMIQRHLMNYEKAFNGRQAIELMQEKIARNTNKKPYSLILMDLNMPIMSGIEVLYKLIIGSYST